MEILGLISFLGIPVTFIGLLIQILRKKPNKKKWGIALIACFALFLVSAALTPASSQPAELTNIAEYDDCSLELLNGTVVTTEEGYFLKVQALYTNSKETPQYGSSAFAVRAFQNDKELDDWSFNQDNSGNLTREVRNGASVNVFFLFKLNGSSEVEVLIGTPTANMETIGKRIYLKSEG